MLFRSPEPNLEAREHEGPLWRIDLGDPEQRSAYVSAQTGRLLELRGSAWRWWDFFWMLHNMDYAKRTSFNHPLIVFVAFGVTGPIPPTELGVTLAMAVLLDATIVRVMLVPATMALLRDRNWYAPKWLLKILPHVNFNH